METWRQTNRMSVPQLRSRQVPKSDTKGKYCNKYCCVRSSIKARVVLKKTVVGD